MNRKISSILIVFFAFALISYTQEMWKENDKNPIFDPIRGQQAKNPSVLYDEGSFNGHGIWSTYKMWYATESGIALAYSNNGRKWTEYNKSKPLNGLLPKADFPKVIYDSDGFGGSQYFYKIWYWSGTTNSISSLRSAASVDGTNWVNDQPIQQHQSDSGMQLITGPGIYNNYFSLIYGLGSILYNSASTNPGWETPEDKSDDKPLDFKYLMYYNSSSDGLSPEGSIIQTSLAYSGDGIYWIRYGDVPVMIPSGNIIDWNGLAVFNAQVIQLKGGYFVLYSGSNNQNVSKTFIGTNIGYNSSSSGTDWIIKSTPVLYSETESEWKKSGVGGFSAHHNYSYVYDYDYHIPVLFNKLEIWYTGWNDLADSSIGYACTIKAPSLKGAGYIVGPSKGFIPLYVLLSICCDFCDEDIEGGCDWNRWEYFLDIGEGTHKKQNGGNTFKHTFKDEGEYDIFAGVKDCRGQVYTFNYTITVNNPIIGCITSQPVSGVAPLTVSFDADCSEVLNSKPIATYDWDFDDDQSGSGKNVFHTFSRAGDYYVVLEITNTDGIKRTTHRKITVLGVLPPVSVLLQQIEERSLFRQTLYNNITWTSNSGNSGLTVVKYNIYRKLSSQPDSEYRIIGSVDENTFEFIDNDINSNESYSYVLTSVESSGQESVFSMPVMN